MTGVRSLRRLAAGVILLAGAGLLLHSYWIEGKAVVAQVLLERAWVETSKTGSPHKAWSWADTWPVAELAFPKLGKKVIVLKGASGEAMAFAPGLVEGTPYPGARGTSVISAHRDTHFALLKDMEMGDPFQIETETGETLTYEVTSLRIVRADASGIDPDAGGSQVALVTCYPFEAKFRGPLRYVVTGTRVS